MNKIDKEYAKGKRGAVLCVLFVLVMTCGGGIIGLTDKHWLGAIVSIIGLLGIILSFIFYLPKCEISIE